jgi:hypothetical protein
MKRPLRTSGIALAVALLAACSSGSNVDIADNQSAQAAANGQGLDFSIAYIKKNLPQVATDLAVLRALDDVSTVRPILSADSATATELSNADVYLRSTATPGGTETNLTASVTQGGVSGTLFWDARDLDVSPDGTQLVFALRDVTAANLKDGRKAPTWHIWTYNIPGGTLTQLTGTADDTFPNGQDLSPHFLADGRIVFSSTRQTQSKEALTDESGTGANVQPFEAQTESKNESDFVLHVMNPDGTDIHQISFSPSHDLDAALLPSGRIAWTRWDDTARRTGGSAMHLYSGNPDGTDVQLLFGAESHDTQSTLPSDPTTCQAPVSTGTLDCDVEFLRTQPMQDGRHVLSLVRPFKGGDFGGNLQTIDISDYVENNQSVPDAAGTNFVPTASAAMSPSTQNDVLTQTLRGMPVPSPGGRYDSAFPLWDGTGRILVSWNQCRLQNPTDGTIVACTESNLALANAATPTLTIAPPLYSLWLLTPSDNTLKPVAVPVEGVMISDVVSLQPRTIACTLTNPYSCPSDITVPTGFDPAMGILDIRSVYDFDGVAKNTNLVNAQLTTLAALATASAANRPARFLRLEQVVPFGDPKLGDGFPKFDQNIALGGSVGFMRQLMGYVPIEPDGSVRAKVPANVAFQISVVDANAQEIPAFPRHTAWLTLRPGEIKSCNGCHVATAGSNGVSGRSHGRADLLPALNAGQGSSFNVAQGNGTDASMVICPGDTMAQEVAGTNCNSSPYNAVNLSANVVFQDPWGDGMVASGNGPISYTYGDLTTPLPIPLACAGAWSAPCRSIIDYPNQLSQLWQVSRGNNGVNTCTNCHTSKLPVIPTPVQVTTIVNGLPVTTTVIVNVPQPPAGNLDLTDPTPAQPAQLIGYTDLVDTHTASAFSASPSGTLVTTTTQVPGSINPGNARGSCFFLTMTGQQNGCSMMGTVNHSPAGGPFMTPAELRLLSEWVDIGAQYYNNPFDAPLAN